MNTSYPSRTISRTVVISMLAGALLVAASLGSGHERKTTVKTLSASANVAASAQEMSEAKRVTLERVVIVRHRTSVSQQ